MKKRTQEDVFAEIKSIHGDTIDLSHAEYTGIRNRMLVTCTLCGRTWEAIPQSLLQGHGCQKCSSIQRGKQQRHKLTKDELIQRVKTKIRIHQNYDYSLLPDKEYELQSEEKVDVICPKHGKFNISIKQLADGTGCPECYSDFLKTNKLIPEEEFRLKLKELNPNLSYEPKDYYNTQTPIEFTCSICGHKFKRKPNAILFSTHTCPECNKNEVSKQRRKTNEEYIEDVKKVWGDKYGTEHIHYISSNQFVTPTCPVHGDFKIEANSFLQGHGCPYHYTNFSKSEKEILDFVRNECGFEDASSDRKTLGSRNEIDIFIPEKSIGFEYDGLYWHSELTKDKKYHLDKTNKCKEHGVTLYHIFEDEWKYKRDIVESMIENILGKTPNRIFARKCKVMEVTSKECSDFLINNHIQGNCYGKVRIGLYYNEELVSVMLLGHSRHFAGSGKEEWELLRMCSKIHYSIVGGSSKMFSYFIKTYNPQSIITFADKRWSVGNVYHKLGFMLYNESKPNYYYIIGDKRYYRYNFRKQILISKYGCPQDMTEKEFCYQQKWYRIYDCGCLCFKWINNKEK